MKILMIGGTGVISAAVTEKILNEGNELYLINRGNRNPSLKHPNLVVFTADIHDEKFIESLIKTMLFDVVVDFIAFEKNDVERSFRLFNKRTAQYIFISSASIYQKPPSDYLVTESTPLCNPYWDYSQKKIACENYLMKQYQEKGFPITIVRPIQVYDKHRVPVGIHGLQGSYSVVKRIRDMQPVIIHGDGTSLWTFTYSTDFAEAFYGLLGNIHAIGQAVNIAPDEAVTWDQLYESIAKILDVKLNAYHISTDFLIACGSGIIEPGKLIDKKYSIIFDNSKLKRLVPGYHSKVSMYQGVKMAVDYVMSHKDCQTEDPAFEKWCDKVILAYKKALLDIS